MPYIPKQTRKAVKLNDDPITAGELNYLITSDVDAFLVRKGLGYDSINTVIGVLECVKLELYRRIAAPYEDKKCEENGDVYTCQS